MTTIGLFETLLRIYGPQGWWPAGSFDELCLGAILVQNTSWNNATMALSNLGKRGLLSLPAVAEAPPEILAEALYPAGTYRRKALVIKTFSRDFSDRFKTPDTFRKRETTSARKWLLGRKGIGHETADCILCYGAGKPYLVIDRYTRRLARRTGLLDEENLSYKMVQRLLQKGLPPKATMLGEFHALIVKHCKEFCGKRPSCLTCPLSANCPFPQSGGV
ncbi:MAG: endonuclease III domain-containing protein [Thermovirgaceae bacterium]